MGVLLFALNLRIATGEIPPVLPDLPLSLTNQSLLVTIPVLCFGLAAFAAPWIRARLGDELALFLLAIALLVGIVGRVLVPSLTLLAGTAVCGVAVAVMNVMMPSVVRRRFPNRVGTMTAGYTMALSVGGGLAAGLTVPLRSLVGGSLQWALGLWAIPAAIAVLAWLPQLRISQPPTLAGGPIRGLLGDPLAWQVTAYFGLQSAIYYSLLSWVPAIFRDRGLDPASAGGLLGVLSAIGIVTNLAGPVVAGWLGDQRPVVVACWLLTLAGLLGLLAGSERFALAWAVLLGLGTGGSFSLALLLIASRARDAAAAASLSSLAQGVGYLVAAGGPLLVGLLHAATGGWQAPLLGLLGVSLVQLAAGTRAAGSKRLIG